ncbi:peroxiredoxin [Halonotius terrestris]|uniref:thioredoxin-dependent peroxiredoxin n=1 Tax=Halonotius terrestris TaxID=2487750 RepID=A0A8J8P7C1_9EURY|nr:peroxiredoxin [Halonotius terrestris]TQQ80950.1 peroxiredoxin [Halonotius terrestris]
MLEVGDPAPTVTARNQHGETVSLDFDDPTVLYFYPKNFTGGCTIEANGFQAALPEFREVGVGVYGVSMEDTESHAEFADEEGIIFDLLADPDGDLADAFGLDTDDGHTDRRTFVLADGEVVSVYDPELADPSGHAREVLRETRNEFVRGG